MRLHTIAGTEFFNTFLLHTCALVHGRTMFAMEGKSVITTTGRPEYLLQVGLT